MQNLDINTSILDILLENEPLEMVVLATPPGGGVITAGCGCM